MSLCVALIIKCGKHVSREPPLVSAGHLDNRVMSCTTLDYIVFTTSAHHQGWLTNKLFFQTFQIKINILVTDFSSELDESGLLRLKT